MKKSILQFSVIAAIAASMTLTTSCSSDDSAEAYVPEPINFNASLGNMDVTSGRASSRAQVVTTAVPLTTIDEKWDKDYTIGIWTTDADGNTYLKSYEVSGTGNTATENITPTNTTSTGMFYWRTKSDCHKFIAYSYGDKTTITAGQQAEPTFTNFTVVSDQSTGTNKELLLTVGYLNYGTAAKTITLGHQLAQLIVTVTTKKDPVSANLQLQIGDDDIAVSGNFTVPTPSAPSPAADDLDANYGSWSAGTQNATIIPRVKTVKAGSDGNYTVTYAAVVIPQNFVNKKLFKISYDGAVYVYTGKSSGTPNDNLSTQVGQKITYNISLENSDINVTQATIAPWGTVNKGDQTAELQP